MYETKPRSPTPGQFAESRHGNLRVLGVGKGLEPGDQHGKATSSRIHSLLDISLDFTGSPPATGSPNSGGVPAQGPTTSEPTVFFSKLIDARTVTSTIGAGDTLNVDSLVTSDTGPLSQSVTFTLDSGVDGITGIAAWEVAGAGQSLVGVDISLFDANTNALIADDTFTGVLDAFAHSKLDVALGPGTYRLVATGTGIHDASLDIALSFTGVPAAVPEPATNALLIAALAMATMFAQRHRGPDPKIGQLTSRIGGSALVRCPLQVSESARVEGSRSPSLPPFSALQTHRAQSKKARNTRRHHSGLQMAMRAERRLLAWGAADHRPLRVSLLRSILTDRFEETALAASGLFCLQGLPHKVKNEVNEVLA